MTATHEPTRAEIAARIKRGLQQRLPEVFARRHDAEISELLDHLLAAEPEPA